MSALGLVPGAARGAAVREARGGTLILGGGFGGAHVARLLGSATVVSPESSLLYTPLLPEVAAGTSSAAARRRAAARWRPPPPRGAGA